MKAPRFRYLVLVGWMTAWMEVNRLVADGAPVWARYNPPFTLWFLRRNEILVPLAGAP
jgi:hypothetical protein